MALLFSSGLAFAAPAVIEESALNITSESATLQAGINPEGVDTRYHFEYDTSEYVSLSHGEVFPSPGGDTGSGASAVTVEVRPQDLKPNTLYHFRVVIEAEGKSIDGKDETFMTQSVGGGPVLSDGRAWELISPPNKHGATIEPITNEGGLIQAAKDGSAFAWVANASIEENPMSNPSPSVTQAISTRHSGGGWSSQDIATRHGAPVGLLPGAPAEYLLFSPDLSLGLVEPLSEITLPPLPEESAERTIYLRQTKGDYLPLVTSTDVTSGEKFGGNLRLQGSTPDLSHVVLDSSVPLTTGKEVEGEQEGLYEWAEGHLLPVSVLPDGQAGHSPVALGDHGQDIRHAISDDGLRVVWTEETGNRALYMRDLHKGETIQLNAAEPGASGGASSVEFQMANSTDSVVLFTDESRLTSDSTAASGEPDLYLFEVTSKSNGKLAGQLRDLTVDAGQPADVQGLVIGAGEDDSSKEITSLYFVARGVLANNENRQKETALANEDNLYMLQHANAGWKPTFMATLSPEDSPTWGGAPGNLDLGSVTSRVSPNGRYLAFMSERNLTGHNNLDVSSTVNTPRHDEEVFLYDAESERLVCASCNPTGARPVGVFDPAEFPGLLVDRARNWGTHWIAANIPGWTRINVVTAYYQSRYLSDNGRLYFNSPDSLVPQDTNGVEDVYAYEPEGGVCQRAGDTFSERSGGCISLISSGASGEESTFLDASEAGNDVFFLTTAQLIGQDHDAAFDVYDARECTVVSPCASPEAVPPPACMTADSCKAAPTPQPALFGAPPSATFSGTGNIVPATTGRPVKVKKPKSKRNQRHKRNKKKRKTNRIHKAKRSGKAGKGVSSVRTSRLREGNYHA